jgi:hypothetical protein
MLFCAGDMSREPDFPEPDLDERIVKRIHEIAGTYTLRILHWIAAGMIAGFLTTAGGIVWATKLYIDVQTLLFNNQEDRAKTELRVASWSLWREAVDHKLREHDSVTSDRWRRSYHRAWAVELQQRNPMLNVPDVDATAIRLGP